MTKLSNKEVGMFIFGVLIGGTFGILGDLWVSYFMDILQGGKAVPMSSFYIACAVLLIVGAVLFCAAVYYLRKPEEESKN